MAREPGSSDRFPLRRSVDSADDPREVFESPVRNWRPARAEAERLEVPGAMPPRDAWWGRPAGPASPAPPEPPLPPQGPGQTPPGPDDYSTNLPVAYRRRRWKWLSYAAAGLILLFFAAVGWLALTAPLSKSLEPPAPPSITLLAEDGTPIARRGAVIGAPVDVTKLPAHVGDAFVAIEDRRFQSHWGVDPRGVMRAMWHNATNDGSSQGGSTITQQLAKNAFLTQDRTITRKLREVMIAFWLEAWLTKEEILSRYLSNVYFGDNVYGLRAASRHYFSVEPEKMTVSQATLLAGLVKAPSRLAPTGNLKGARERQKLVIASMVDAELLTPVEAARVRPGVLRVASEKELPSGTYFADWVLPQARDRAGGVATEQTVRTTLDTRLQREAERTIKSAGLGKLQAAMVVMHPDGRVVAMVGGRDYRQSAFNRATQAQRQPGSTFKLFVYLAALRSGMTPDTMVDDSPVTIGEWTPKNDGGSYAGKIPLRRALSKSSNVVAAKLTADLGPSRVIRAARDLGISTPIANEASVALGTSSVSLLELTSAYAAVANGTYPVRPVGLGNDENADDWLAKRLGGASRFPQGQLDDLREMLRGVIERGTGRGAALPIPAYGKSGTTQDGRDALFVGWAGDLVVGVWIGNDDNSPSPGLAGGGLPARLWRDFMVRALDLKLPPPPPVAEEAAEGDNAITLDGVLDSIGDFVGGGEIGTRVEPDEDENEPEEREPPRRRSRDDAPAEDGGGDEGF